MEKDRALQQQKSQFLERQIAELQAKEASLTADLKAQKHEHTFGLKEVTSRNEQLVNELTFKLEEAKELLFEKTSEIEALEQKHQIER